MVVYKRVATFILIFIEAVLSC